MDLLFAGASRLSEFVGHYEGLSYSSQQTHREHVRYGTGRYRTLLAFLWEGSSLADLEFVILIRLLYFFRCGLAFYSFWLSLQATIRYLQHLDKPSIFLGQIL